MNPQRARGIRTELEACRTLEGNWDGWDGSAACDNEQHIAEVLSSYGDDA